MPARLALILLLAASAPAADLTAAELKPETVAAFDRYVRLTEARIQAEVATSPFLRVDTLPAAQRDSAYQQLRRGEVVVERLQTRDGGKEIEVPGGLIHHWVGTAFIPGATLPQTVALLQDYDNHHKVYQGDVLASRLLERQGDRFRVWMRFHKKKVITVVLNTEHEAEYFTLDARRVHTRSRTTRIAEVEDPGEPGEREKPPGQDGGFLWRLNSYWRLEERDGGVYIQLEAVSLTRDVPFLLRAVIGPYIRSIPRESLFSTMEATRRALAARARPIAAATR